MSALLEGIKLAQMAKQAKPLAPAKMPKPDMHMEEGEIDETLRGPNFDTLSQKFGEKNYEKWKNIGKHVGDIENFKVLQDGIHYSVWDNDTLVAFTSLSDTNVVDDVWVNPAYRGKKVFSMLLWFYKTRLGRDKLMLGPVHSPQMQEIVKGLSRFNKNWVNVNTHEIEPFSIDTLNDYYSSGRITPWRLMLESQLSGIEWPMFNTNSSYILESFSPYIE
jgi:hypothetical protein